jgi:hypothetical protein
MHWPGIRIRLLSLEVADMTTDVVGVTSGMTDEEKLAVYEEMARKAAAYDEMTKKADEPIRYRVIVSLKTAGDRVLFSSVSQKRAKRWIEDHCPRGSHFFLSCPDGSMLAYEHERHSGGPRGEEIDPWQEFDRDAYQQPELAPVSSHDPWADAWEGAQ